MINFMYLVMKRQTLRILEMIGEYVSLVLDVFFRILRKPPSWRLVKNSFIRLG